MTAHHLTDAELGALLATGDGSAMDLIFDRFRPRLLVRAAQLVGDPGLAEDVVQECMVSIWMNSRRFDPTRGSLSSWLFTCLRNRATDSLRRRRPVEPLDSHPNLVSHHDPAREGELSFLRSALSGALLKLPSDQRQAVSRAYVWGQSSSVIADRTGSSTSTVKGRLRLARAKLRTSMADVAA